MNANNSEEDSKIIEVEGDMSRTCRKCKSLGDYDNTWLSDTYDESIQAILAESRNTKFRS